MAITDATGYKVLITKVNEDLIVSDAAEPQIEKNTIRVVIEYSDEQYQKLIKLAYMGVFPPTQNMRKNYPELVDELIRKYGEPHEFEYEYMSAYLRDTNRADYEDRTGDDFGDDATRGDRY